MLLDCFVVLVAGRAVVVECFELVVRLAVPVLLLRRVEVVPVDSVLREVVLRVDVVPVERVVRAVLPVEVERVVLLVDPVELLVPWLLAATVPVELPLVVCLLLSVDVAATFGTCFR